MLDGGVDPKPWLEYGALGAAILLCVANLMWSAWMTSKHFSLFRELIPILESVKGNVKALQALVKEAKESTLNRRRP